MSENLESRTYGIESRRVPSQVAGHLFEGKDSALTRHILCMHKPSTIITEGKAGSLVDKYGRFYKPLQVGPRGNRERAFYETLAACLRMESSAEPSSSSSAAGGDDGPEQSSSTSTPYSQGVTSPTSPRMGFRRTSCAEAPHAWQNLFSVRNAALLNVVPRFCTYGWSSCMF